MKLLVGLGNPGPRYAGTRHNVGFDVIDYLAAGPGVGPYRRKFEAQVAELVDGAETVLLLKPETFMNLSGQSVRAALDFYKIVPDDLMVVCDDMSLPLGKLRIRASGTHGGHNGLRNIQDHLGSPGYPRLRVGVGAPNDEAIEHVLGRFRPGEKGAMNEAVALAAEATLVWVRQGIATCMNRYNGSPESKKKPAKPAGEETRERKPRPAERTEQSDASKPV